MPARSYSSESYRYGFNGQEKETKITNTASHLDFGARIYDSRISRFLSIDPKWKRYPMISSYCFANNNPIRNIDIFGEGPADRVKKASSFLGTKYSQEKSLNQGTDLRTGNSDAALEYLDCSELVCRVLFSDQTTPIINQWSTKDLETKLSNAEKFHKSNDPKEGDVFLWRSGDKGHTGIVKSYNPETGEVVIIHAKGTKYGTVEDTQDINYFTGHNGWKGFFRPINEHEGSPEYIINQYYEFIDNWTLLKKNYEKGGNIEKAKEAQAWIDATEKDLENYIETGEENYTIPEESNLEKKDN